LQELSSQPRRAAYSLARRSGHDFRLHGQADARDDGAQLPIPNNDDRRAGSGLNQMQQAGRPAGILRKP
jgi:hypothetical protein